jgi:type VI secretion system FHA domain protein
MIVLTVISYNGAHAEGPSARFDEIGGTIGRADGNQLVLPDPERTVSRVHARIVYRATGYAIIDCGSNPIAVRGTPLGSGHECPLEIGDQVQIGGYLLEVAAPSPAVDDPFADLFGEAPALALPTAPAVGARPATTASRSGVAAAPTAPVRRAAALESSSAPPPAAGIPEDWDPFAPEPESSPLAAAPAAAGFGALPGSVESLDLLFGLDAAPGGDPFGGVPAGAPKTAGDADPLRALSRPAPQAPPASVGDAGSELNTPLPAGAVFSWDDPPRDARVITLPGVRRPDPEPAPLPPGVAAPAAGVAAAAASDDAALLAALLEGLQAPELRLQPLDAEAMRRLGALLREAVRGTLELLVARAALKREMRAELTMIVARENNPLKFSPTVEVALQHLLGPASPGFMPAVPALRDAFDDLRAHQLGVMAGMRAALDGVLQRFDPQQLEAKIAKRGKIGNLIPAARKARLWELFEELYGQLSSEAQDDFEELFGKAFVRAYEAQLARLEALADGG